jgi:hypothetical protein
VGDHECTESHDVLLVRLMFVSILLRLTGRLARGC